jgi:ADP-ribosylglycohydrolase
MMPESALERARLSLEGLSVGDAFGEEVFRDPDPFSLLIGRQPRRLHSWRYSDDTEMALSVFRVLRLSGGMDQDQLADSFARYHHPERGYGLGTASLLQGVRAGLPWRALARANFAGEGSCGNGAAMRVAPVGAYFAGDFAAAAEQARRSAEVTHAHPEGIAGAIAVAVAAALVCQLPTGVAALREPKLLEAVSQHVPAGEVREGIGRAARLPRGCSVLKGVQALGNGSQITAQDTVPYVLWCAARNLGSYEAALWFTASGLGDIDTTCAMVGGIVALRVGWDRIPAAWREAREPLPDWAFEER